MMKSRNSGNNHINNGRSSSIIPSVIIPQQQSSSNRSTTAPSRAAAATNGHINGNGHHIWYPPQLFVSATIDPSDDADIQSSASPLPSLSYNAHAPQRAPFDSFINHHHDRHHDGNGNGAHDNGVNARAAAARPSANGTYDTHQLSYDSLLAPMRQTASSSHAPSSSSSPSSSSPSLSSSLSHTSLWFTSPVVPVIIRDLLHG